MAKGKGSKSVVNSSEKEPNSNPVPVIKRGPGRPKGSKNKPKQQVIINEKRKPGRPKGSKNKPK